MLKSFLSTLTVSLLILYWFGPVAALITLVAMGFIVYKGV